MKWIRQKILNFRRIENKNYFLQKIELYTHEIEFHRNSLQEWKMDLLHEIKDYTHDKNLCQEVRQQMVELYSQEPELQLINSIQGHPVIKPENCFYMSNIESFNLIELFGQFLIC
jgi:hypothetical protein